MISAGLRLDGGGRALAGRLLARAAAEWARARGVRFDLLALGTPDEALLSVLAGAPPDRRRFFGRSFARLAAAAVGAQLGPRRPALLFDLLGLARTQSHLPRALRAPYLVMLYGIEVWRPLERARRRALDGAEVRLSISRYTLSRARELHPGLTAEILPLALEERAAAGAVDRALVERAGEGFALIVGRMDASERYKGHDPLLEALPGLPSARLVIAGGGDDRARLEAKAAALGVAARVLFSGFVSEATLRVLYDRAAALAMPSRGEGFGLVYLEAMRASRPCLAARASAAAEVVADGETGLLVDPENRAELAAALARLLGEPETAARMGKAGRMRFEREFGYSRFRDRLSGHLDRLTDPRSPGAR
ncbi:MAG TPA: glycosyltransferase family 4 protein [Thermoanaerobaculia bacterium]|nr:glycosyltransferase family 4 protein [Thermoanaerobaculia bacterium]